MKRSGDGWKSTPFLCSPTHRECNIAAPPRAVSLRFWPTCFDSPRPALAPRPRGMNPPRAFACRAIVAKAPRVMSLDMASTVPRKIGDMARAFAVHTNADAEETAAMMAQVPLESDLHALPPPPAPLSSIPQLSRFIQCGHWSGAFRARTARDDLCYIVCSSTLYVCARMKHN